MVAIVLALALFTGVSLAAPGPGRIVGGSPTTVSQYPAIAQVSSFSQAAGTWLHGCGGNILSNNIVLTAAHCLSFQPSAHAIRAGATIRSVGGVIVYVSQLLVHPNYYQQNIDGDIAMMLLASNLVFGPTINSIPIPPQNYVVPGNSLGTYAGWGFNYENTDVLLHVQVNILSHAECENRYNRTINQDIVCAGYNGTDACNGDSGGPLYYGGVLVGTVAWGPWPCGHPTEPGATVRVGYYTNWIVANSNSFNSTKVFQGKE